MQKFRFRLDSVLRLRSLHLSIERDKLGQTLAEATRLEQALVALAAERAAAVEFVKTEPGTGNTELRALSAYLLGYESRRAKLQQSLEKARLRVVEQRQRVVVADRDERLLLKLKTKQRTVWQAAADQELEVLAQESWNSVHFDRGS
jgi:flagellar export protein FliJ